MSKRVVHVITTLDLGGAQATVAALVAGLDRDRFDPLVVAGGDVASGDIAGRLAAADVPLVRVASLHRAVRLGDARALDDLRRTLHGLRPDLVQTHSSKAGVLGRAAARLAQVSRVVHTVHGWSFHQGQREPFHAAAVALERSFARLTDAFVVVTDEDRRLGLRHHIGNEPQYRLIRSGLDLPGTGDGRMDGTDGTVGAVGADRDAARHALGLGTSTPVVGWVGRFARQKDPSTLAATLVAVLTARPDAVARLVGTGPAESEVRAVLRDAGVADRVGFLGLRDDAAALVAAFDVMVSSSAWEGLPRTVVEALAAGVPVVSTDVGGVAEVVRHRDNGWLASVGDVRALADGVEACLRREVRGPDESERRELRAEFATARMVERTEELYDDLFRA